MGKEDFDNWDALIRDCDNISGLTDTDKESAKLAFRLLQEQFGDHFLEQAISSNHPLEWYFVNRVPWTRKWLTSFAFALHDLRNQQNFASVKKRLIAGDQFYEGNSVLMNAFKLYKAGYEIEFDPKIEITGKEKSPDLRLFSAEKEEKLYVEVSSLKKGKGEEDAENTMKTISMALFSYRPKLHISCRIYKALAKPHLEEVASKVKETLSKVNQKDNFQELNINGVLELGVASDSGLRKLRRWARKRELKEDNIKGPPIVTDETVRTRRTIRTKQQQIPPTHPNIVVIHQPRLFLMGGDLWSITNELEEEVYGIPHLLLAIITGSHLGIMEPSEMKKDDHLYIQKQVHDLRIEKYLFLYNRFCENKIPDSSIEDIINSYRTV